MSNIDLETLEAYLEGKLATDQKQVVEESLTQDSDLKEELELLKLSRESIQLDSWSTLISETQNSFLKEREKQTIQSPGFWVWSARIAASLAFFLVVSSVVLISTTSPESINKSFGSYQIPVMRGGLDALSELEDAYSSKDFEKIESIRKQTDSFNIHSNFILAMADLQNGNPESAEQLLKKLESQNQSSGTPLYSDEIEYYLVQSLVQQQKYEEAENRVNELLNQPDNKYAKNFSNWDLWKIRILKFKKNI
ncbi:MAG: tetratricopeptide repeat protein [Algoriphagus sp.]|uniref:tetratricopeptide repeat protein n=1 Tax=Algoriphagus sp. TaxID=1872435 RepID=UPI0026203768|nr:tetratricopeptide repeat protein [Algoriphagus sp.]MDG1278629.1 tetratricopeptide repeat protein [Algoriphagus sp.]